MGIHCAAWWCHCFALSHGIIVLGIPACRAPRQRGGLLFVEEQPVLKMQCEMVSAAGKRSWLPPQLIFAGGGLPPDKPVTLQCPVYLLVPQNVFHAKGLAKYLLCTMSCPDPGFGTCCANSASVAGLLCSGSIPFVSVLRVKCHSGEGIMRNLLGASQQYEHELSQVAL